MKGAGTAMAMQADTEQATPRGYRILRQLARSSKQPMGGGGEVDEGPSEMGKMPRFSKRFTLLAAYTYVCSKCYKTTVVEEDVVKDRTDLLRKHFCPDCQKEMHNLLKTAKSSLKDAEDSPKQTIEEIAKREEMSAADLTILLEEYKSKQRVEADGLRRIEEKTGKAFIATKSEILDAVAQQILNQRNESLSLPAYKQQAPPADKQQAVMAQEYDDVHQILTGNFQSKIQQDRMTTEKVAKKNW